jgi:hypothetical protein
VLRPLGNVRRRQLKHRRVLTLAEVCDQGDLAVEELERVVMRGRLVEIDLPEARDLLPEAASSYTQPDTSALSLCRVAQRKVIVFFESSPGGVCVGRSPRRDARWS